MTNHQNLKILAFVGPSGSGKTAAVQHFTKNGFPKIHFENLSERTAAQTTDQVQHLVNAGQHRIVIDDFKDVEEYHTLKHTFPGEITSIAISWKNKRGENKTIDADDLVSNADYFVVNDGSLEDLYKQLDAIAREVDFS